MSVPPNGWIFLQQQLADHDRQGEVVSFLGVLAGAALRRAVVRPPGRPAVVCGRRTWRRRSRCQGAVPGPMPDTARLGSARSPTSMPLACSFPTIRARSAARATWHPQVRLGMRVRFGVENASLAAKVQVGQGVHEEADRRCRVASSQTPTGQATSTCFSLLWYQPWALISTSTWSARVRPARGSR